MDQIQLQAQVIHDECTRCRTCITRCAFLQKNGTPGDIAASVLTGNSAINPFACSLCNLCTTVCPSAIAPGAFFLNLRRHITSSNLLPLKPYATILGYEQLGNSDLFSWYGLPAHCDTVFFPGCSLPGTRPEATWWLYQQLKKQIPQLGMVLDCCHKPSHDLGRQHFFLQQFTPIRERLINSGIRTIIVACPNCHKVFQEYGQELQIRTVWEILVESSLNPESPTTIETSVTVHDPCPLRDHQGTQQAVRTLIARHNLRIEEMRHSKNRTLCCGEGGSVGFVQPDLARKWGDIRRREAGDKLVITYCAGCAGFLNRAGIRTIHLADLLVNPNKTLSGKARPARAPWTYLHRLRLKLDFRVS